LSEEEEGKEEEEEKDQSLHRALVSTPRMGYESVQRRLVEWNKQQRRTTKGEEEEEEEGEAIEIQKRTNFQLNQSQQLV
jgi:predicted RNA-binding protein with RPS1 domain